MVLKKPISADDYIAAFPASVQVQLEAIRAAIRKAAPDAEEIISYQMPTFKLHGNLVHFAAWKSHIGFYPAPSGLNAFAQELSRYKVTKGAVQFPFDQPVPLALITKIVRFRVKENLAHAGAKEKKKERICSAGHRYIKSSDCPTCPVCASKGKPAAGFLSLLSSPARRVLENEGITTLKRLSGYSEREILALHGMGKASLPQLRSALQEKGLSFRSR